MIFALRFDTMGRPLNPNNHRGTKEWFALCVTCDTIRTTEPPAIPATPAPVCAVCHPEQVQVNA